MKRTGYIEVNDHELNEENEISLKGVGIYGICRFRLSLPTHRQSGATKHITVSF